jgi:hypothetical protein
MNEPRWDKAAARLEPVIDSVDVVVSAGGAASYYYLKHVHVMANNDASFGDAEFSLRWPLGVPVISRAAFTGDPGPLP